METYNGATDMEQKQLDHQQQEGEDEPVQIYNVDNNLLTESRKKIKWWLFLLNCFLLSSGVVGTPLTVRFYYQHGGSRKWLQTWLQAVGFPILFIPLTVLYYRNKNLRLKSGASSEPIINDNFAGPKLLLCSAVLGLLAGLDNFMFSTGLAYIPVSTSTILLSTQLAFTAIFAFIIVKHKFTPFSINTVILMTLGSILLGLSKASDRPPNVSRGQYFFGFFMTLAAAALLGLYLPLVELAYAKGAGKRRITYIIIIQFQIVGGFFSVIIATVAMLINHDFTAVPREAKVFDLGQTKYYLILVLNAVFSQFLAIGSLGLIFCSSSFFSGVLSVAMIPVSELFAALLFKEKFNGLKGMSLALSIWGVTSYFYGAYREVYMKKEPKTQRKSSSSDSVQLSAAPPPPASDV